MQYVLVSEKALSQIDLLERCYLTDLEKESYLNSRQESFNMNMDKVKLARKQYRNQGEYIEDISDATVFPISFIGSSSGNRENHGRNRD